MTLQELGFGEASPSPDPSFLFPPWEFSGGGGGIRLFGPLVHFQLGRFPKKSSSGYRQGMKWGMQERRDRVLSPVAEVCRNRTDRPTQGRTTGFEVQGGHQTTCTSALIIRQLRWTVQQPQAVRRGGGWRVQLNSGFPGFRTGMQISPGPIRRSKVAGSKICRVLTGPSQHILDRRSSGQRHRVCSAALSIHVCGAFQGPPADKSTQADAYSGILIRFRRSLKRESGRRGSHHGKVGTDTSIEARSSNAFSSHSKAASFSPRPT